MPVSGNEEPGVLSRQSINSSAGIPLKKRRFLLVQPPSPPRVEAPSALSKETDVKNVEEFGSNLMNMEGSCSDLQKNDLSGSDMKHREESSLDVKNKDTSGSDLNNTGESALDLANKVESKSDQGPFTAHACNTSPPSMQDTGKNPLLEVKKELISDINANLAHANMEVSGSKLSEGGSTGNLGSGNKLDSRTKLLLTENSASPEIPGLSVGVDGASVKKEILSKQVEEDCKLKLSVGSGNNEFPLVLKEPSVLGVQLTKTQSNSPVHEKIGPSLLSLSLSKENPFTEEKTSNASLSNDGSYACANRSNWDLNTTMDDWGGSAVDSAFQGSNNACNKPISMNNGRPLSRSTSLVSTCSNKGKSVVATDEHGSGLSSSPISSVQISHQSEESLRLTLSTASQEMNFGGGSSAKVGSRMDASNSILWNPSVSTVSVNSSGRGMVKLEPIDENSKITSIGATASPIGLIDFSSVKKEPIERLNKKAVQLSTGSSPRSIEEKSVKSEPVPEVSQQSCKTADVPIQLSVATRVHSQEGGCSSSVLPMPSTPQKPSPSRLVTSSELSASMDVSNQSEHSVHTKEVHMFNEALVQAAAGNVCKPVHKGREKKAYGHEADTCETEANNVNNSEISGSKRTGENSHDLRANGEGSVSDEEKLNISTDMMEDESYGSDYESDSNQAFAGRLDTRERCVRDDDDYEDGEVREPLVHSTVENPITEGKNGENMLVDHVTEDNPPFPFAGDSKTNQKDNELKLHDDKNADDIMECVDTVSAEKDERLSDKAVIPQKLLPDEIAATGADEKSLSDSSQRKPLDQSGRKSVPEVNEKDISCDGTSSGHKTVTTIGEATDENAKLVNMAEKPDSSLSMVETTINENDAAKDSISGGNKSRIITLPRASVTSPCKTRSIPDRSFSSRSGRERYSDYDGEKYFLRGNRDEIGTDGLQRFIRERIQDQPFRNSRPNYMRGRGRGRFSGRLDTSRNEWDSERGFALENYNDDYRFSRNKRTSAMNDTELESNDYVIAPDGAALSTGRGRKHLNDLPSFRHASSRRQSPGGRVGPTTRDIHMIHRIPRNISPVRRHNDENETDLVGLRQDEKFVRALPNDIIDPAYGRPQSIYEGGDGQFVRGNRNFPTVQRRGGFPRVRSKSPVGSRPRSPGPWSSPRRRSPDGFSGLSQLAQHRSAALYGVERMRSPDHPCFPEEMVARRRGSPSYMARPSNDTRDMDSGREHGHPRPINSNRRSPSDRVFNRSTRRLDVLDPRMRTGDDEFFGRPAHSTRCHEFHGDGSGDDRRKCGERRGLIRSFRPPYIGNSDNLRFHLDDGPRPFRFGSDADTEFGGRSMRDKEFDGRIKNRPMVAPRRIRTIDEQEGNYRQNGQVWHDDGFNEASGFKRRRF